MKSKSCGSCTYFVRIKNWWTGGICDHDDYNTTPDSGRKCKNWKGIKYKRTKEKLYAVE